MRLPEGEWMKTGGENGGRGNRGTEVFVTPVYQQRNASPPLHRRAEKTIMLVNVATKGGASTIQRYPFMERGNLKFFDTDRGFGFIEPQDGSEDVFLHANNITGATMGEDLREGQEIAYEVEQTEKGLSALNASPVE